MLKPLFAAQSGKQRFSCGKLTRDNYNSPGEVFWSSEKNSWRDLDKCFGTNDWKKLVYDDQPNLFGEIERHKVDDAASLPLGLYIDRLKGLFIMLRPPVWFETHVEWRFITCSGLDHTA